MRPGKQDGLVWGTQLSVRKPSAGTLIRLGNQISALRYHVPGLGLEAMTARFEVPKPGYSSAGIKIRLEEQGRLR